MPKVLEKVERRLGEKLFLKGERCIGAKCAHIRRPYPPGAHGKGSRASTSEFGVQLREKQKVKFLYGLRERMFSRYFSEALRDKKHPTGDALVNTLEKRLDNVLFRAGFVVSRSIARNLVSYGHVFVNKRAVTKPSYSAEIGDIIELSPKVFNNQAFGEGFLFRIKKYEPPEWIKLDKEKKTAEIVKEPYESDLIIDPNIKLVVEYYSR